MTAVWMRTVADIRTTRLLSWSVVDFNDSLRHPSASTQVGWLYSILRCGSLGYGASTNQSQRTTFCENQTVLFGGMVVLVLIWIPAYRQGIADTPSVLAPTNPAV